MGAGEQRSRRFGITFTVEVSADSQEAADRKLRLLRDVLQRLTAAVTSYPTTATDLT